MRGNKMHGVASAPPPGAQAKKQRFVTLDGMRGVAALVVVFRHIGLASHTYVPRFSYLAVDLFFILSGFVLAFSYDQKFDAGLDFQSFMRKRVVRLAPLYTLGLLIGVASLLLVPGQENASPTRVAVETAFNGLGLPSPLLGSGGSPFPVNAVFWSLFFELWVANLVFGCLWQTLHGWRLYALIALSAIALIACERAWYTMDVGTVWRTFLGGFARVGFSFFAGVALARLHRARPPRLQVPSWACLVAVLAVFVLPLEARAAHAFELVAVFLIFPALIFWGTEALERRPRVGAALGDASYAAYTLHYPLVTALVLVFPSSTFMQLWFVQLLLLASIAILAIAAHRWFDVPIRQKWLR